MIIYEQKLMLDHNTKQFWKNEIEPVLVYWKDAYGSNLSWG